MQPPLAGRTGKAPPPPVGPPGSFGGGCVSLDNALVAVVGGGVPLCDAPPAMAPHPTSTTNNPAPARNAITVLITSPTVGPQHDMRLSETCATAGTAGGSGGRYGILYGVRASVWRQGACMIRTSLVVWYPAGFPQAGTL